jgi:hypothetical protein
MISRRTASAVLFAVVVAAGMAFAAEAHAPLLAPRAGAATAQPLEVIVLPMVQVIGHRSR